MSYPAGNYMFKVNNTNAGTRCEICSKLTIKTPERRNWRRSSVFIVNFAHILHLALVFLLLTLNKVQEFFANIFLIFYFAFFFLKKFSHNIQTGIIFF